MITPEQAAPLDETVWAWDGGNWWRVIDGICLAKAARGKGPRRNPSAREVWRGTWLARALLLAVQEVVVMHIEADQTRWRFEGDLGAVVVISDVYKDEVRGVEYWKIGENRAVGWRMGAPVVLVMGMADRGEEVRNAAL